MDLVVFSNHMNKMNLGILKDKELDLFMSICLKLRDEGTKKIELEFSELKELSNYEIRNYQRFLNDLRGVNKKLLMLNCEYETETEISGFVLFTDYTIHKEERKLTVQVNEKFKYILNELTENFTKFELNQFVGLNSQYSKTIFRLLKQFTKTGWREFFISDFRELLNIPEKYRISEIDKKVLNEKIITELSESFTNLRVSKIKEGRVVKKIRFEWDLITVIPKERPKKSLPKTNKEINTENLIKKQSEEIELAEIINREINEKYNNYLELQEELKLQIEKIIYNKFLENSNATDNKILRGIFEKSKKPLIVEEYEEILEGLEKEIQELTAEELELIKEFRNKKEKEKNITDQERFMSYGVHKEIDNRYYHEKVGFEELFTDEDLLNDLTEEGYLYAENFITYFQLFDELLSKNKKELKGNARKQKLIKVFKENYINEFYGVYYKIAEERMLNKNK